MTTIYNGQLELNISRQLLCGTQGYSQCVKDISSLKPSPKFILNFSKKLHQISYPKQLRNCCISGECVTRNHFSVARMQSSGNHHSSTLERE